MALRIRLAAMSVLGAVLNDFGHAHRATALGHPAWAEAERDHQARLRSGRAGTYIRARPGCALVGRWRPVDYPAAPQGGGQRDLDSQILCGLDAGLVLLRWRGPHIQGDDHPICLLGQPEVIDVEAGL